MLYIVVIVDLICKGNGELEIITLRGSINYYYYLIASVYRSILNQVRLSF